MASGATCWTSQAAAAARAAAAALSAAVPPAWPAAAGDAPALVRPPPWVSATPRAAAASSTAASSTTVSTRQRELPVRGRTRRCHQSRMVVASTVPQDGVLLAGVGRLGRGWFLPPGTGLVRHGARGGLVGPGARPVRAGRLRVGFAVRPGQLDRFLGHPDVLRGQDHRVPGGVVSETPRPRLPRRLTW